MAHHRHATSWTERTTAQGLTPPAAIARPLNNLAFQQRPHTSLGFAGHLVYTAGIFAPMLAGEFIECPKNYKKVVSLASIGTALAYETLYLMRESKRREQQEAGTARSRGE